MPPPKPRLAVIVAQFHPEISRAMVEAARDEAGKNGLSIKNIIPVPGSYEIPLLAQWLIGQKKYAALVVLGFIEKGETLHGQIMGQVVHQSLVNLQLQYKKPIGLGIIGPGATLEQAKARQESSARAAVRAVSATIRLLRELK